MDSAMVLASAMNYRSCVLGLGATSCCRIGFSRSPSDEHSRRSFNFSPALFLHAFNKGSCLVATTATTAVRKDGRIVSTLPRLHGALLVGRRKHLLGEKEVIFTGPNDTKLDLCPHDRIRNLEFKKEPS